MADGSSFLKRAYGKTFWKQQCFYVPFVMPLLGLDLWLLHGLVAWLVLTAIIVTGLSIDGPLQRRFWPDKPPQIQDRQKAIWS